MFFGALTWMGFMVVAVGWALLLSSEPALLMFTNLTGRALPPLTNLTVIAQCAIITGLGLAIVGTLRTGFGALSNFFDSVLERTSHRVPNAASSEARVPPAVKEPAPVLVRREPPVVAARREPPAAKPVKIVERGRLKDRGYVLFGDGSVEVETLLGLRRFASIGEAHKFIG